MIGKWYLVREFGGKIPFIAFVILLPRLGIDLFQRFSIKGDIVSTQLSGRQCIITEQKLQTQVPSSHHSAAPCSGGLRG